MNLTPLLLCRVITDTLRTRETTAVTGRMPRYTFRYDTDTTYQRTVALNEVLLMLELRTIHRFSQSLSHLNMSAVSAVNDWKYAAIVLDRVCLLTFTLFTLIATVVLFSAAPHILVT